VPSSVVRHVVWDWNGTLLDDHDAVYRASAELFAARGLPPITLERYRAAYTRPISAFYQRLFGVAPSPDEMAAMDDEFHAAYRRILDGLDLTPGAREVLAGWRGGGRTQSLLSMFRHRELVPLVHRHGIAGEFTRIDGLTEGGGGHKLAHLERHLDALGLAGPDVLLVGDSVDDADAAAGVGAACVLYDGGSHPRATLDSVGVPVVDTLAAALRPPAS
jgi:phosphoglycolate phosphatase-like HAD superfamily hydrolase